jgi:ssRNA-specific RNase YbeY (16S rRNA maturation enzyme)
VTRIAWISLSPSSVSVFFSLSLSFFLSLSLSIYLSIYLSISPHQFSGPEKFKRYPHPAERHLGDIIISPDFVLKQCQEDRQEFELLERIRQAKRDQKAAAGPETPVPENEEDEEEEEDERGVSGGMAKTYTLEERIPYLLIHSMLHLLGYDHETDEEWLTMVTREEEVLRLYNEMKQKEKQKEIEKEKEDSELLKDSSAGSGSVVEVSPSETSSVNQS